MIELNKQEILIIGGSGFVGPRVVEHFQQAGYDVSLLNRGTNMIQGTHQLTADRNNATEMAEASQQAADQYDAIIDLSSYNEESTRIAWETFSSKTDCWLHLSSASVYKNPLKEPPQEREEIGGADVWGKYGADKSEADSFLLQTTSGPSVTIFRPPYLYGPGNNHDRESFVWARALQKRPVVIPNTGITHVQFLHVDDLASALLLAIQKQEKERAIKTYNIAETNTLSLTEYVKGLCEVIGTEDMGVVYPDATKNFSPRQHFPFRDFPCWVDVTKIKQELGWQPQFEFISGHKDALKSYDLTILKNKPLDTEVEDLILSNIKD